MHVAEGACSEPTGTLTMKPASCKTQHQLHSQFSCSLPPKAWKETLSSASLLDPIHFWWADGHTPFDLGRRTRPGDIRLSLGDDRFVTVTTRLWSLRGARNLFRDRQECRQTQWHTFRCTNNLILDTPTGTYPSSVCSHNCNRSVSL